MVAPEEKRRRVEPEKRKHVARSRIFQPFRALGYITNDVPFVVETRGQDFFLTTSVGHNFQTYNMNKMHLLFVSPTTSGRITAMTASGGITYVAHGSTIGGYKRGKPFMSVGEDQGDYEIIQILVLGQHVATLCDDNVLRMWDLTTGDLYTAIEFGDAFTATKMIHPSTYLNKILVASAQGTMQIWNVRVSKMIYQFKSFGSAITCLEQSPVVDVVAIGLLDGSIVLHNIRMDERIDTLYQSDRVTAISFRTDEEQMMATANMHGDVALWDLANRKLAHDMKGAHSGLVSSIAFLNNQPILVTAGADNAVTQWIFEKHNAVPLPLKGRSGHYAPPSKIRYYGSDGKVIVTAGRDQALRWFSTVRDAQSVEMSQGHIAKKAKDKGVSLESLKLPIITDMALDVAKEKEWANVLTCHLNDSAARTWSTKSKALDDHVLLSSDKSSIKSVNISACGNFGFIGCASGQIEMFNLQSGLHRRTFSGPEGHKKAVTSLASDTTNRYLISVSVDRNIKIWNFQNGKVLHTITMESPIVGMQFHRDNNLMAVACDDLGIRVIDIETQKVVREFWGHRNRITDFAFSPDGRWIISASLDATVRTWDLPSSTMVDIFKVEDVVSSLTFSPTGDFLATAHVDNVGVFLWANRTQFANVSLHSITDDDVAEVLALPALEGYGDEDIDDEELEPPTTLNDDFSTVEQLADDMITMSLEPRAKWHNLLNLDTIKQRNKPKEAPKAPEQAPFFLPTLPGAQAQFDLSDKKENDDQNKASSHRVQFGALDVRTKFTRLLEAGHETSDFAEFVTYAKSLSPSALDVEIRTMPVEDDLFYLNAYVEAILFMLRSRKNFEMAQAWLNAFLNIHGDLIIANPENSIHTKLKETLNVQSDEFNRLSAQIHYGLCLIDFARK